MGVLASRFLFLALLLLGAPPICLSADWFSPAQEPVGPACLDVISSTDESTIIDFEIPGVWIDDSGRVRVNSGGVQAEIGRPDLPAERALVAIPPDAKVELHITKAAFTTIPGVTVGPWQKPPLRPPSHGPQNFEIDQSIYSKNAFWPARPAAVSGPMILRDHRVVQVSFNPVQYNPKTGELRVYSRIQIELIHSGKGAVNVLSEPASRQSAVWQRLYQDVIVNYDEVRPAGIVETERMLIIVHDSFYDHILPYADWKRQKGVDVTVVKKSDAGSTANQIKSYIQGIYNTWDPKPEYVLLVGDVGQIPWFRVGSDSSDMPYAFLAGSDILADVTLARFSVENNSQLDVCVQKSIEFEKSPYTGEWDWFDSATVIASNDYNDFSNGQQAAQKFRDNGFTHVDEFQERWGNNTWTNVNNAINDGRSWIWYIGHGWRDGWATVNPYYDSGDVRNLQNGRKQPVIVSTACNNCDLDAGECFGEVWMRSAGKGAANFFGYTESCAFFTTDALALGVLDGYFDLGYTSFGSAIDYGRIVMFNEFGGGCSETMHQSILIGDPDQFAWSDTPSEMDAAHPDTLPVGESEFAVAVSDYGSPIADALVCIWKGDEVWMSGRTDSGGNVVFYPEPETVGTMLVTVSARNYFVYEGSAEVTEGGCKETTAPNTEPYCSGALFGEPERGYPAWVWFSIPLDPDDCCPGGDCSDPEVLLGFDCNTKLWYWDRYSKSAQVYNPPFLEWDLFVGEGYLLRLDSDVANPSYLGLEPRDGFENALGRQGWTWIGLPGSYPIGYPEFMSEVGVEYPVGGPIRTAHEDRFSPDPWLNWGWPFWDTFGQTARTFTPYLAGGFNTCYPWVGYRVYVNVGTAQSHYDDDQAILHWP